MSTNEKGMSLVEVLVSLLLVSVVTFGLLQFTGSAYTQTRHNTDRQFAITRTGIRVAVGSDFSPFAISGAGDVEPLAAE